MACSRVNFTFYRCTRIHATLSWSISSKRSCVVEKLRLRHTERTALVNAGRQRPVRTPAQDTFHWLQQWTTAVKKLAQYRRGYKGVPIEGPAITSWRSNEFTEFLAECTHVSIRSSCTNVILWVATTTRCGWSLTDEACFTSKGAFNIHNSHSWEKNNPRVIQIRFGMKLWAGVVENTVAASTCYTKSKETNDIVICWKLFYRLCIKMCL
jgi:hypothetical protein